MHVIATAGHVDHGKSTLIRSLTGMEPDRWAEEQRRGLTIDLGFAWTSLQSGGTVAFVDVPGHQSFITNMLAGVGPVSAVLFVVAADEGWCAQSAEHLEILDALQVRHGVLAITRADLADAQLAEEEARTFLAGTSLADVEAVAVSPVAGTGLDELCAALERMTSRMPLEVEGRTRLWVDRAFSVRGAGTVVTGTLSSGVLRNGDELQVHPSGKRVRVRGIQSLKQEVVEVRGIARVALNLRGVKPAEVRRGAALTAVEEWADVSMLDVRLSAPLSAPRRELVLHVGSAAVGVRVRSLGPDTARLELAQPLPVSIGDRGVMRDPGAQRFVAAATVLDIMPPALRKRGAARTRAAELSGMAGEPDLADELRRRGIVRGEHLLQAGVKLEQVPPSVTHVGDWLIETDHWKRWKRQLTEVVDQWAQDNPSRPGVPPPAAAQALELPEIGLLESLVGEIPELVLDSDGVRRPGRAPVLPPAVMAQLSEILNRLEATPFSAPEPSHLISAGLTERYLGVAAKEGWLVRLAAGVYVRPEALDEAVRRLGEVPQPFTVSDARQAWDTTRRVAVPLLELLDRRGITRRVDAQLRLVRSRTERS